MENWLVKRAKLDPDKIALILEHADFTFGELNSTVQAFAGKLYTSGIRKNDPVALFSDNCFNGYVAILALQQLGARTIFLDTELPLETLTYQVNDCQPKTILISDSAHTDEIVKINWDKIFMSEVLSMNGNLDYQPVSEYPTEEIASVFYTPSADKNDTGVMLTYGNYFYSAMGTSLNLGINKRDVWVLSLPTFSIPGFSIIMRSLIYGISVYLIDGFDIDLINKILINERATIISLTPPLLRELLNGLPRGQRYNEHFRCVFLGTGLIDSWTVLRCNMLDIPVLQTYGMTETTANISALNFNDAEIKSGSCGQPFFTTQIRITNINQDNVGCIEVKSPTVALGYLNKDELFQSRFTEDGFFKTGDVGYLDDDNFLYLKGRQADLIYIADKIVYPEEVENVFRSVNGIKDICVVGTKSRAGKTVPIAYLTLRDNAFLTSANLADFGKHNLLNYQVPMEYRQIDEFPRSTNGKILRNRLVDLEYKVI